MDKYRSTNISFIPKSNSARWISEVASTDNRAVYENSYTMPKTQTDLQALSLAKSWKANNRIQEERPMSIISSKLTHVSSDDRFKMLKNKATNNACEWSKILKIILAITVICLTLVALTISIYTLVDANRSTTITTTTITSTSATTVTTSTTTTTTSVSLPLQCSAFSGINDATRLATTAGGLASDPSIFSATYTWYRFSGAGGTQIVTSPPAYYKCGGYYSGWYAGQMPASYGGIVSGTVCYVSTSICYTSNMIFVTNCGSYYVYGLIGPPITYGRYCTV